MSPMEREAYQKSFLIASIGASNPVGAAHGIWEIGKLLYAAGFDSRTVAKHPAYRAAVGHLAFLAGLTLGPEADDLMKVEQLGRK